MANPCTLYEYLTQPNPAIQLRISAKSRTYTKNIKYPRPKHIQRWTEFNATTIETLFKGRLRRTLDTKVNLHDYSHIPALSCRVHDEISLKALIAQSNQPILQESLTHTSQDLLLQKVSMVRGSQAQLYHTWRRRVKQDPKLRSRETGRLISEWYPDWAGLVDVHGDNSILPGDAKVSRNWRSDHIKDLVGDKGQRILETGRLPNVLWPIRQLLHYCVESHMRYGYIITDEELVVMRVRPMETQNPGTTIEELHDATKDNALVEFQSIPWKRADTSKELSVNLALYVLFILAANNGTLDWTYGPLVDETLPTTRPQVGLCNEYPSFSTSDGEHSQNEDSAIEAGSPEALASSAPNHISADSHTIPNSAFLRSLDGIVPAHSPPPAETTPATGSSYKSVTTSNGAKKRRLDDAEEFPDLGGDGIDADVAEMLRKDSNSN
ncbi:hypothetical protein NUW58_g5158 [Xylaria curta]|uniref:Uncharacterized protein n=1 Tax=Xylaria curta TaxID=42375 RepID=A0ACC1P3G7_9PEZI|nr:hypothetical protein NUW58_g5158 [Xylaria curta]